MVLHDGGWTRIAHIDMTDTMEVVRMEEDCMKRMLSVRPDLCMVGVLLKVVVATLLCIPHIIMMV